MNTTKPEWRDPEESGSLEEAWGRQGNEGGPDTKLAQQAAIARQEKTAQRGRRPTRHARGSERR